MKRPVAIAVLGVTLLIATIVVTLGLTGTADGTSIDLGFFLFLFAGLWLYWALGALIVLRGAGHLVGWLLAVAAAMTAWVFGCFALGFLLAARQPPDTLAAWFLLVGQLLFPPAIILLLPAVALVFPTGTLPGRRWRWPVALVAAMVAVRMLVIVIKPGPIFDNGEQDNPLTSRLLSPSPDVMLVLGALENISGLAIVLACVLGVGAVVVRFRRSHGDERQQLKWFLAAMTLAAVLLLISLSELGNESPIIGLFSVATLPVAAISVAVAILRYRLYDIDRIISRSISYGVVTALLVTVFLLVNLGLQALLSQMTSGNSLAIAASTLLAAGLFTPIRWRVQRIVDRRFDRARYDADETATAFSIRMRDATDLPTVASDLDVTVREAIAPSRVGLWLR